MGRPREHDEHTRAALLASSERLVREHGVEALTVRALAAHTDTTTRAIYSVFGSKDALLSALAADAFDRLGATVAAIPCSDDPIADIVACTLHGYRRWALANSHLYRLAFEQIAHREPTVARAATNALGRLRERVQRAKDAGLLNGEVGGATIIVQSLCEGLIDVELRGTPVLEAGAEPTWQQAVQALLLGMQNPATRHLSAISPQPHPPQPHAAL